jgi:hypothetical protein
LKSRVLRGLPPKSRALFLDMLVTFLAGHDALINIDEVLAGRSRSSGRRTLGA